MLSLQPRTEDALPAIQQVADGEGFLDDETQPTDFPCADDTEPSMEQAHCISHCMFN